MQVFIDAGYSKHQIRSLNTCRMYTRAITTADITTGDGLAVRKEALKPTFRTTNNDNYRWPTVGKPNKQAWQLWETAIEKPTAITVWLGR